MALRFELFAAAVLAPGLASLRELIELSRAGHPPANSVLELPSPAALPAAERRRASQVVRLTLACAEQALASSPFPVTALRMVFASDEGTGEVCQQMLQMVTSVGQVSPLLFHNSVHNAPSGYFSIAYRNPQSATAVSLGAQSFAAGLLCAASDSIHSGEPVLFLSYDAALSAPMHELLPILQPTATAWIIAAGERAAQTAGALASFELGLHAATSPVHPAFPDWLPSAWRSNSSAQGLLALALLEEAHDRSARTLNLALGAQSLRVTRLSKAMATTC